MCVCTSPLSVYCADQADGTVRLLDSSGTPTSGAMEGIVEMSVGNR